MSLTLAFNLLVDGNWSEWNDWGVCTNKCGDDGVKMRQRTCDNPKPLFGGKDCAGSAAETVECNRKTCAGKVLINALRSFIPEGDDL